MDVWRQRCLLIFIFRGIELKQKYLDTFNDFGAQPNQFRSIGFRNSWLKTDKKFSQQFRMCYESAIN